MPLAETIQAALDSHLGNRGNAVQITTAETARFYGRLMDCGLESSVMVDAVVAGRVLVWAVVYGETPWLVRVSAVNGDEVEQPQLHHGAYGWRNRSVNDELEQVVADAIAA